MLSLDDWFASGERVPVDLPPNRQTGDRGTVRMFCRTAGSGSWITFLHGFPTCSWDWAAAADALEDGHHLLMPDLLGFGDSDKPHGHQYSLVEQADLLEAIWRHFDVSETGVVAHDIGGSITQELLARQLTGQPGTHITRVVFFNSALFESASRPRRMQQLLAHPMAGPALARLATERSFVKNLAAVFSPAYPLQADVARQYWSAFKRGSGSPHIHRLLAYIPERKKHHVRWEGAMEHTSTPLRFVWGMRDPVSGVSVVERLRARLPDADLFPLDDVGHYPHVEAPHLVVPALVEAFRAAPV
jgi:pimeloyl-ACP methyl ester carboxylesterase